MGEGNGRATGEEILAIFKSEWKAISRRWTLLQGLEDVCMQRYDLQRKATAVMWQIAALCEARAHSRTRFRANTGWIDARFFCSFKWTEIHASFLWMTAEKNYAVGVTLKEKHWRHLTVCPKDFYASLHRNTDSVGRETIYSFIEFAIVSTILQDLLQLYWAFSFLHIFVRASSLVWVKQTGWIEQTGCISCDWQMNTHPVCDERRRPTEYVIVSLHVCVFFSTAEALILCLKALWAATGTRLRASAGKFSPDSLHITRLTLLSLWWCNPSAHRQTCAHLSASLHARTRAHPPTYKQKPPRCPKRVNCSCLLSLCLLLV